jgi:hypothetical protein
MRGEKVAAQQDQRHRNQPCQGEAERLQELERQERASDNQSKPNRGSAARQSLLELFLVGGSVPPLGYQLCSAVGIYDRVNVECKSTTKKDPSKKAQVSQLKKARNSQEVHNRFHVLTIVDGSQTRQKYPEQRGQSSAASGAPRLLLSRQTLNAQKYAVLTIRVSLYSMVASRAQGTRAASALGTRCI